MQASRTRTEDLSFTKAPAPPTGAIKKAGFLARPHQFPAATPLTPRFYRAAQGAQKRTTALFEHLGRCVGC